MDEIDNLLTSEDVKDDLDSDPCPETGFHDPDKGKFKVTDQPEGMAVGEDEVKVVPAEVAACKEILDHVRHFVSMVKRPEWQILALDISARCVRIMRMEK